MDQDGRDAEFSEYVAARWGRLVRAAVLLGCSPTEAEDVVQTTLTKCLVSWAKVRRADDRDAYVHRVLINTFTSGRRRRWTRERPVATLPEADHTDHTGAADDTTTYDDADAIARSLERLTPEQRTAVVLRYYSHLTERQMAAALGIAPGTVKSRLSRALKILAADPTLSDLRGAR
ncbi:SigE family RNA polymerase sigma factor [Nocardioides sp. cx-173]|uniref:SigE family RNA polymerase sigma factor n=1 Tax=Nocardioides sp. cx-173 TaxID=2898796 RepID=UPI001E632644|nr:SigE family RNA polymerase sigma factor [Nocardioides sp. cx-173]MCD4527211.1 SigE family RNA polymerase sigma factor [Nocardioides sp. cx-173]UGB40432.1 SigE family RNA polymerase sigma factor [Nocardioides sp. cx-173]